MENIYKKIENELKSLSVEEREKILIKLREEIDATDKQIVPLLGKRSLNAILIGRIKRTLNIPTYDPEREKEIAKKIISYKKDPLSNEALLRIYERIIDESRSIQNEEIKSNKLIKIPTDTAKVSMKNILPKKYLLIVLSAFILFMLILYYIFFTPNYYEGASPKKFEIKRGESLSKVTENLYSEGIISNKTNFKIAAFIYGAEKKIRAARFYIPNGLSYLDLVEFFLYGDADFLKKITLRDGVTIRWIAAKLKSDLFVDSAKFIRLTADKELIDLLGLNASSLEGYLLPQEYYIYERSSAEEALDTILTGFNSFFSDSLKKRADTLNYSLHEILTIASIVDGETNKVEEMPAIAGVYYNRLKIGMKLQADPTVQYLQKDGWKRLLYKDLRIDNPYNTYLYEGLPPGPINNPGKDAIFASFYPEDHDYLFFVAEKSGGHKFAKNYTQHLKNVREFREWIENQSAN